MAKASKATVEIASETAESNVTVNGTEKAGGDGAENGAGETNGDGAENGAGETNGDGAENDAGETDEDDSEEESGEAKDLIALRPILYLSRQYKVGDKLPANNPNMVQAWIDAKSAAWVSGRKELQVAKPVTAEPGLSGRAFASETDTNLVGKVPRTVPRRKQ